MPKKKVTEAVEEVVQEPVVSEPVPPQAPRRQGSDDLLELNDLCLLYTSDAADE